MLFLLRKIRKKLVSENKITTYLLYAVGEIILVVVGILIAVQIDHWSEARKDLEKQNLYLLEILADLKKNEQEINLSLTGPSRWILNSLDTVIYTLQNKEPMYPKMERDFSRAFSGYGNVDLKTSSFESLRSSGLDIIKNAKLRNEITDHFNSNIPKCINRAVELRDDYYSYMLEYLRTEFIYEKDTSFILENTLFPKNYKRLYESELLQSLKVYQTVYEEMMISTSDLLKKNKELQQQITEQLEK